MSERVARFYSREDGADGYGVWDGYLLSWVDSDDGTIGLSESDADYISTELNRTVLDQGRRSR